MDNKHYLVALWSVQGVGQKTFFRILNWLNKNRITLQEFWVSPSSYFHKIGLSIKIVESINNFKKEQSPYSYFSTLKNKHISVVTLWDKSYPKLLREIDDPPPILFVKGKWEEPVFPVGIVGTRKITGYGELITSKISRELTHFGATIVSGFMYGVDVLAQQTALENNGKTVGLLGFGFDHMYPRNQQQLFDKFLEQGAVFLTEFAPEVAPAVGNFPRRNRLVAGLSRGVVVTEAAERSGSHITANCALDYGRSVFAVPGPITNKFSEGTKSLINQGAKLISSGEEVFAELKDSIDESQLKFLMKKLDQQSSQLSSNHKKILNLIAEDAKTINQLCEKTNWSVAVVSQVVSELQLMKKISKNGSKWWLLN